MQKEILAEKQRLIDSMPEADETKLKILDGLIEQAAYETVYLKQLNAQAAETGLIKIHPRDPAVQKPLPVSAEISRHSATLTNILDKLCKHLASGEDEDYDDLADFE